jgi:hypothetical protein
MPAGLVKEINAALADPKNQGAILPTSVVVPTAMTPTDFDNLILPLRPRNRQVVKSQV